MLDIEFTIQEGHLYMLQCRVGKRTGTAALNMALDMAEEKLISREDFYPTLKNEKGSEVP